MNMNILAQVIIILMITLMTGAEGSECEGIEKWIELLHMLPHTRIGGLELTFVGQSRVIRVTRVTKVIYYLYIDLIK